MSIAEKLTEIAESLPGVYDAGKKSQYDEFWDYYQENGYRKTYYHAFAGIGWNEITYKPKYPIVPVGTVDFLFAYSKIKKLGDLDLSKAAGELNQMIRQCSELEEIGEITINNSVTKLSTSFYSNSSLKTIKKLKFGTISTFTNTFVGNGKLVNIILDGTIAGNISFQSSPLSKASIESVVNALSASKSGLTVTFLKDAINTAFGIDIDDEETYPEGSEYYTLRNTKSNWTFNYV